jgi:hypothetical protein
VFFACIYVPNFLAQAAVRLDPTAAASPFAVVAGDPPQVRVLVLDDCLYGLQATVPHLTRSSLHRCLQAISNLLWCNCAQSELNHLSAKPQMPGVSRTTPGVSCARTQTAPVPPTRTKGLSPINSPGPSRVKRIGSFAEGRTFPNSSVTRRVTRVVGVADKLGIQIERMIRLPEWKTKVVYREHIFQQFSSAWW